MPKLELKLIQGELEKNILRPLYWLYGGEELKVRELVHRIKQTIQKISSSSFSFLNEDIFYASETEAATLIDAAKNLTFGGGTRFLLVREAHLIKDPECLEELMGPPWTKDVPYVCVFIARDLDQRKKFSKTLLEKAALVPCEEVSEGEREAWIAYLAKLKGMKLSADEVLNLRSFDPWNLSILEKELEKLFLLNSTCAEADKNLLSVNEGMWKSDQFLESFFQRDLQKSLQQVGQFANQPEESIPLLGLIAWNLRHFILKLSQKDSFNNIKGKFNPYLHDRLNRWSCFWTLDEVMDLHKSLFELDFSTKQTPRLPLGLWTNLVIRYCR
ncbi:MAG: hypothetical protein HY843_08205 [Bdellovibrio sp.]|nr:hypothetical protein [Bdellovibrio sp.]